MDNLIDIIKRLAHAQRDQIIEWRRWMHRHPDLSQLEYGTMEFVADRLREMGLEPKELWQCCAAKTPTVIVWR